MISKPSKLHILLAGEIKERKALYNQEIIERKVQAAVLKAKEEAAAAAAVVDTATTPPTPLVNEYIPMVQQVCVQPPDGPNPQFGGVASVKNS